MNSDTETTAWQTFAMQYLERLGRAEYDAQRKRHKGTLKSFKFKPSEYMESLIECTKQNDEEKFKTIKMLEGYASELKV